MAVQPGLCRTWSKTTKTGFLRTRLISGVVRYPKEADTFTNSVEPGPEVIKVFFMPNLRELDFEIAHKHLNTCIWNQRDFKA